MRSQLRGEVGIRSRLLAITSILLASLALGALDLRMSVSALACGYSPNHYYSLARSSDVGKVAGTGAQAAWDEQNYVLGDPQTFVTAEMWVVEAGGLWNEAGFVRQLTAPYYGNGFFRATQQSSGYHEQQISKAVGGAFTWHLWQIKYDSATGVWQVWAGEQLNNLQFYGGWSNPSSASYIDIGNETPNNCSTINITYYGSPSQSDPYAFHYRTGAGQWTTWGSGQEIQDSPYHSQWLTYAIYRRGWGP